MMPPATRTLCECQPSGTSMLARILGFLGSATSTIVVPLVGRMCPTYMVVPSTQTCPPPGQSQRATSVVFDRDSKTHSLVWFWRGGISSCGDLGLLPPPLWGRVGEGGGAVG